MRTVLSGIRNHLLSGILKHLLSSILKYFKIHDLSIKTQLTILIIATAAPLFAAGIFIHRYTVNSMVEKLLYNHLCMMERAAADVDTFLYDIEALVNFLCRDRSLRSMLSTDYNKGNYDDFLAVTRCHDMIESQVILNDNIVSVYVISMHHRIKHMLSKVAFLNAEYMENYKWYREMDKTAGSLKWIPARQNEDNDFLEEYVITCVSPVINPNTGNTLGHVSVTVREGYFDSLLGKNRPAPCGTIFLTDQDGRLFYSSEKDYLDGSTTKISDSITNKTDVPRNKTSNPSGFYFTGRGKNRLLVTYNTVSGHQWKIVSTVPLSWVTGELNRLEVIIYSVILLCMVLTLFLAGIFYRGITGPVDTLKKLMENVGSGDFSVNGRQINSRNEIKKYTVTLQR